MADTSVLHFHQRFHTLSHLANFFRPLYYTFYYLNVSPDLLIILLLLNRSFFYSFKFCHFKYGVDRNIQSSIDKQKVTILVLFDFSRAFISVNHKIPPKLQDHLISKSILMWFLSFSSHHSQTVDFINPNKSFSSPIRIT